LYLKTNLIVIGGPTSSGKSSLSLALAKIMRGVILNADSKQVYKDLKVLSARPIEKKFYKIKHYLYGFLNYGDNNSVYIWRNKAIKEIEKATNKSKIPFIIGGSGFYINYILNSIYLISNINILFRKIEHNIYNKSGKNKIHRYFFLKCSKSIEDINENDKNIIVSGWEFYKSINKSTLNFKNFSNLVQERCYNCINIIILPLKERINEISGSRFRTMLEFGGISEVEIIISKKLKKDAPIMRTIGVNELFNYINGLVSLEESINKSMILTRNYVKRQITWFKHKINRCLYIDDYFNITNRDRIIEKCLIYIEKNWK